MHFSYRYRFIDLWGACTQVAHQSGCSSDSFSQPPFPAFQSSKSYGKFGRGRGRGGRGGRGGGRVSVVAEGGQQIIVPLGLKLSQSYVDSFTTAGVPETKVRQWMDEYREFWPCPEGGWKGAEVFVFWDIEVNGRMGSGSAWQVHFCMFVCKDWCKVYFIVPGLIACLRSSLTRASDCALLLQRTAAQISLQLPWQLTI